MNTRSLFASLLSLAIATLASAGTATLSWTDNSTNEDGFQIERKQGDGPWLVIDRVSRDATTWTDDKVAFGPLYLYRVCAYNAAGFSGYTNEAPYRLSLPPIDEIPKLDPPNGDPSALTADKLARGLEAFAQSLRDGEQAQN